MWADCFNVLCAPSNKTKHYEIGSIIMVKKVGLVSKIRQIITYLGILEYLIVYAAVISLKSLVV